MHKKHDNLAKTLGPLAAQLILTLHEQNRPVFHFHEAEKILGGRDHARSVLPRLVKHGIITRLKGGTFRLVPFELGFEREYLGNPYVVARELALNSRTSKTGKIQNYYLSHGSAFALHQMVTQPQFIVYTSSPRLIRSRTIQGTEFKFIRCNAKALFGITEIWVDKNEKVMASDLERTLLDGLKQPTYCGGFLEVAKGFSIKHQLINPQKIIDYALKLNIGAVIRRLGYLMELYQIGTPTDLEKLRSELTATYQLLDPELPNEGSHLADWRLRLNVTSEELLALRGT